MSGIHNMIKVSQDGNIQVGGKGASGSGTSAGAKSWMVKSVNLKLYIELINYLY